MKTTPGRLVLVLFFIAVATDAFAQRFVPPGAGPSGRNPHYDVQADLGYLATTLLTKSGGFGLGGIFEYAPSTFHSVYVQAGYSRWSTTIDTLGGVDSFLSSLGIPSGTTFTFTDFDVLVGMRYYLFRTSVNALYVGAAVGAEFLSSTSSSANFLDSVVNSLTTSISTLDLSKPTPQPEAMINVGYKFSFSGGRKGLFIEPNLQYRVIFPAQGLDLSHILFPFLNWFSSSVPGLDTALNFGLGAGFSF